MELIQQTSERAAPMNVLIIDDDPLWRKNAEILISDIRTELAEELLIQSVASMEEALALLSQNIFQLILLDKELQRADGVVVDGIEQIPIILTAQPFANILMFTSEDDPRFIVRAMQLGAIGYLVKKSDIDYQSYVRQKVKLELSRAKAALDRERIARSGSTNSPSEYVTRSPAMQRLNMQLEALAEVSRPVIFLGSSGLGKGAAARRLNALRGKFLNQKNRPFCNLNVASISDDLALSELFGHEPNSFTGASNKTKLGFFELANNGDLFLDEIGDASLDLQAKLLKVIEEKEFQRVGGTTTIKTNARLCFATHKNLPEMVRKGTFREDLYMRIAAFPIEIPKLEERKDDIPDLIRVFLQRLNKEISAEPTYLEDLPSDFVEHLKRDNVPGNIRGLENDLQRVLVLSPKDSKGKANLSGWRYLLGLSRKYTPQVHSPSGTVSLEQFLNSPTDFLKDGFPGLSAIKQILEQKILDESIRKHPRVSDRAKALRLPISNASRRFSQYKREKELMEKARDTQNEH